MADAEASAALTESTANLHLDEVTGEKISKSELKKREKQRKKDEEKKKKEAAAPPKPVPAKKMNAEADEKELNPNVSAMFLPKTHADLPSNISRSAPVISTSYDRARTPIPILTSFKSPMTCETLSRTLVYSSQGSIRKRRRFE